MRRAWNSRVRARLRFITAWTLTVMLGLLILIALISTQLNAGILWVRSSTQSVAEPQYCSVWVGHGCFSYSSTAIKWSDVDSSLSRGPWWRLISRGYPWSWMPDWSSTTSDTHVLVPLWMPGIAIAATALTGWWPIVRVARRRRFGRCLHCGYDIGGRAETRCPECGGV